MKVIHYHKIYFSKGEDEIVGSQDELYTQENIKARKQKR